MQDFSTNIWKLNPCPHGLFGRYKQFSGEELADWLCRGMPSGESEYKPGLIELVNKRIG